MRILVTGGAGYIGSIVTETLVAEGDEVIVFDNLSQGHRAAVHPKAHFVEGDLKDVAAVDVLFGELKPEAVMHFASNTLVGESMENPFLYIGDNVTNGLNLIRSSGRSTDVDRSLNPSYHHKQSTNAFISAHTKTGARRIPKYDSRTDTGNDSKLHDEPRGDDR